MSCEEIRDLVRKSLIESEVEDEKGDVIGTLTIICDTHIHVDEQTCLEVLVVRGKGDDVRELADNIKAIKGVKHGELVLTKATL